MNSDFPTDDLEAWQSDPDAWKANFEAQGFKDLQGQAISSETFDNFLGDIIKALEDAGLQGSSWQALHGNCMPLESGPILAIFCDLRTKIEGRLAVEVRQAMPTNGIPIQFVAPPEHTLYSCDYRANRSEESCVENIERNCALARAQNFSSSLKPSLVYLESYPDQAAFWQ